MKKLIIFLLSLLFAAACTADYTHVEATQMWEQYVHHLIRTYYTEAFSENDPPFVKIGENTWKRIILEKTNDYLSGNNYKYAKTVNTEVELILILGPENSMTKYVNGTIREDHYETRISTPDPGIRDGSGTLHIDIYVNNTPEKTMTVTFVKNGPRLIDGLF